MPQTKTQKRETALWKLERDLAHLGTEKHRKELGYIYEKYDNPGEAIDRLIAQRKKRMETEMANLKKKLGKE